jgi:hypothetical protein
VNLLDFITEFPTNADVAGWWLRALYASNDSDVGRRPVAARICR